MYKQFISWTYKLPSLLFRNVFYPLPPDPFFYDIERDRIDIKEIQSSLKSRFQNLELVTNAPNSGRVWKPMNFSVIG